MNLNIKIKKASISWIIQAISELSNLPALTDFLMVQKYFWLEIIIY